MDVGPKQPRGSVLIIHPRPHTDSSQHAALWASAPAYREDKKGGERQRNSCRMVGGVKEKEREKKKIIACQTVKEDFFFCGGAKEISLFA